MIRTLLFFAVVTVARTALADPYAVLDAGGNVVNVIELMSAPSSCPYAPGCSIVAASTLSAAQLGAFGAQAATPPTAQQIYAQAVGQGIAIQSTGTPSLNGTYAIDAAAATNIAGIYASIKNGDGLPGGGTTFNYPDLTGATHAFDATSFPNFAKAVRDYLYALSQGQAPSQPATIP